MCTCLVLNQTHMSNFYPLEVLGRGSETQLQVGENLNYLIERWITSPPTYLRRCVRRFGKYGYGALIKRLWRIGRAQTNVSEWDMSHWLFVYNFGWQILLLIFEFFPIYQ